MRASEITPEEVEAFGKFATENHIILAGQDGIDNANVVRNYFLTTWNEVITAETLARALPQLRPHLKIKSTAQIQFEQLVAQEPDRATQLANWLEASQGKPGLLSNTPGEDATYTNLTSILITLRGYAVTPDRIRDAIDRILAKPNKLSYVPIPRRTEPISEAAKADDPDRKPGVLFSDLVKNADGSYRSKTPAEQRAEQEALEASKRPAPRTAEPDAWEQLSNQLLRNYGTTHSQRENMRQTFDAALASGKSWREVYVEMNKLKQIYERRGSYR